MRRCGQPAMADNMAFQPGKTGVNPKGVNGVDTPILMKGS
jgi:hypothetical protein